MDVADEVEASRMFDNLQDFTDVEFFNSSATPQPEVNIQKRKANPTDNMRTMRKVKSKKQALNTSTVSSKTTTRQMGRKTPGQKVMMSKKISA